MGMTRQNLFNADVYNHNLVIKLLIMKKQLLFIIALAFISFADAQVNCDDFSKTYGKAHNFSKLFLFKNKYYLAGDYRKASVGDSTFYITKLDTCGNKIWEKTFGQNPMMYHSFYTRAIDQSPVTGDIFAAVSADSVISIGRNQVRLFKINSAGELIWTAVFSNSFDNVPYSVRATPDGGAIVGGWTGFWSQTNNKGLLIKFSSSGMMEWYKTYAAGPVTSIDLTAGGGYQFIRFYPTPSRLKTFLYSVNKSGKVKWTVETPPHERDKYYEEYSTNIVQVTTRASDNTSIVAKTQGAGFYPDTIFATKYDADGNEVFSRKYNFLHYQEIKSVTNTSDNGYLLTGTYNVNNDTSGIYAIKLAANGDTLWTKRVTKTTHYSSPMEYSDGSVGYELDNDRYIFAGTLQTNIEHGSNVVLHFASQLVKIRLSQNKGNHIAGKSSGNKLQLHVYPNPATAVCVIETKSLNGQPGELRVTDMFGNPVKTVTLNPLQKTVKLDVSNFTKGNYLVSLITGTQVISAAKLMVQ